MLRDLLCWNSVYSSILRMARACTFFTILSVLRNWIFHSSKRQMVSVSAGQSWTFSEWLRIVVLGQGTQIWLRAIGLVRSRWTKSAWSPPVAQLLSLLYLVSLLVGQRLWPRLQAVNGGFDLTNRCQGHSQLWSGSRSARSCAFIDQTHLVIFSSGKIS